MAAAVARNPRNGGGTNGQGRAPGLSRPYPSAFGMTEMLPFFSRMANLI